MIIVGVFVFSSFYTNSSTAKQLNQTEQKKINVFLAGDSTVSTYPSSKSPKAGWGQMIDEMFDEQIVVKNLAVPGRSSKSYIEEGRLEKLLKQIKKGDYLFIQFGHNDQKVHDPTRYTDPDTTYKNYLKQYIEGARKKGAFPILITPVERRSFTLEGKAIDTHHKYPAAMIELGREEHVPVIDLTMKSKKLFQEMGADQTKKIFLCLKAGEYPNYPNGITDNVHFQENGAREMAKLVLEGIEEQKLPLWEYIR